MDFSDACILVFAKAPMPGQVKTRLAARYGERGAVGLYKAMLRRNLSLLQQMRCCPIQLWCAPHSCNPFFAACRRDYGLELRMQHGADLGRRMDNALRSVLAEYRSALVIGGDCVSLSRHDIRFALAALATGGDAVLGPAEDGGYVLIGLRRPCPPLFRGIAWGGSRVLAQTRQRLHRSRLRWVELPLRWDVDRPADVRRLKRHFTLRSYGLPLAELPKDSVT